MRLIDARTGKDALIGDVFEGWQLVNVFDRWFKVEIEMCSQTTGESLRYELPVRLLHPDFLFQRVAFLPT